MCIANSGQQLIIIVIIKWIVGNHTSERLLGSSWTFLSACPLPTKIWFFSRREYTFQKKRNVQFSRVTLSSSDFFSILLVNLFTVFTWYLRTVKQSYRRPKRANQASNSSKSPEIYSTNLKAFLIWSSNQMSGHRQLHRKKSTISNGFASD